MEIIILLAPAGATELFRPYRGCLLLVIFSRGLRPWLLTFAPSGAEFLAKKGKPCPALTKPSSNSAPAVFCAGSSIASFNTQTIAARTSARWSSCKRLPAPEPICSIGSHDGYHVLVRGLENGVVVERPEKIHSVSRALLATTQMDQVLDGGALHCPTLHRLQFD